MKQPGQSRRIRGGGSVYKPKYRTKEGELRESLCWWIKYYKHGVPFRESAHSEKKAVAERVLRKRLGEIEAGVFVGPAAERMRYEDLRSAFFGEYRANGRKSLLRHKDGTEYICGVAELDQFFAGCRAVEITTDRIRAFVVKRQQEGAPNATINRSLSALRRMFRLALEDGRLRGTPYFPMLKERNVRKGFVDHDQYVPLRDALPDYLKPVLAMGYFTGMRLGEIRSLRWEQVSFADNQVRLDPGTTKNDEPRVIPLAGELRAILEMQLSRRNLECPDCPFVFFHRGKRIGVFLKAWRSACIRVGLGQLLCAHCSRPAKRKEGCPPCSKQGMPKKLSYAGLIFHDLRRTGVRNLVRAGVSERVAMAISGHKTRAIFDRYNIVSERDLKDAARKLDHYLAAQNGQSTGKVGNRKGRDTRSTRELSSSLVKRRGWLRGLDSNQDNQIQSLAAYRLADPGVAFATLSEKQDPAPRSRSRWQARQRGRCMNSDSASGCLPIIVGAPAECLLLTGRLAGGFTRRQS